MKRTFSLFASTLILAACSGGSNSSSVPAPAALTPAPVGDATLSITIPHAPAGASAARRRAYVSPNTQSLRIDGGSVDLVVALSNGTPGCTTDSSGNRTCVTQIALPPGFATYTVDTYASTNGTGSVLAAGAFNADIVVGSSTNLALTLGGVVSSLGIAFASPTLDTVKGVASADNVTLTAKDASGANIIGGSGLYTSSGQLVTVTVDFTYQETGLPGAQQLGSGTTQVTGTIPVTFDLPSGKVTVTASAPNLTTVSDTMTVTQSTPAGTPAPSPTPEYPDCPTPGANGQTSTIALSPSTLIFNSSDPEYVAVAEAGYNGSFAALSNNTSIVLIDQGVPDRACPTYQIDPVGNGLTSITFTDDFGNTATLPVSVQTTDTFARRRVR